MGAKKLKKTSLHKKYDGAKVIFLNYQYESSYNHIISKFISLIQVMPSGCKAIIISLPESATFIDSQLAEHLQRLMFFKHGNAAEGGQCLVLFIRQQDKQMIINQIFEGKGAEHHLLPGFRLSGMEMEPDSLIYSWGNAKDGKLGISENYVADFENDLIQPFQISDNLDTSSSDFQRFLIKKNLQNAKLSEEQVQELETTMQFEQRDIFTARPQPIVSLLGTRTKQIVCGKDHVLALTDDGKLFCWGSNESGQLGIPQKET